MQKEIKTKIEQSFSEKIIKDLGYDFLEKMLPLQTVEDAYNLLNSKRVTIDLSSLPEKHQKPTTAYIDVAIITDAINRLLNDNKEWIPDFTSSDLKFENWYYLGEGPSGFRDYGCAYRGTYSLVGSRLCFISRKAGKFAAMQFKEIFKEYII